jgi:hypothetical protein
VLSGPGRGVPGYWCGSLGPGGAAASVAIAARPRRVKRVLARVARLKNDYERLAEDWRVRTLLMRCLDAIASVQVRRELAVIEHDGALAARLRGVLTIECRVCALVEDQRQQMLRIVNSPLGGGLPAWMDAQKIYSDAQGMIKDHRDLLVFDLACVRFLLQLWPEADIRVEHWRTLLRLGGGADG